MESEEPAAAEKAVRTAVAETVEPAAAEEAVRTAVAEEAVRTAAAEENLAVPEEVVRTAVAVEGVPAAAEGVPVELLQVVATAHSHQKHLQTWLDAFREVLQAEHPEL